MSRRFNVPFGRSAGLRPDLRFNVPFGRSAGLRPDLRSIVLVSAFAFVPAFACAAGDDKVDAPPAEQFAPTPAPSADAEAVSDAPDDVPMASLKGCSDDGFCYVPVPRSMPLIAVSASSADDAWMLPESSSALLHWDGASIKQVYDYDRADPPNITFTGIWAQTRDKVWAVARGSDGRIVLVRHASPPGGGTPEFRVLVTEQPATTSIAEWGAPNGDVLWIATDTSVLRVHEDASGAVVEDRSPASSEDDPHGYMWRGIWGFAPDDVYVAGKVCPSNPCGADSQGAIAHYDGTSWSITTVDSSIDVLSLRGTPPGGIRQVWYVASNRLPAPSQDIISRTELVALDEAGSPGAPLYSLPENRVPACTARVGQATGQSGGWFSSGLLLCRWTGSTLEPVRTAVDGRTIVESLNGIWAGGSDDVWIVGGAITRPGLVKTGFAARRTATTAEGGAP